MTQETKTKTIKVVRYIAVTFALGLGARVAGKAAWKANIAFNEFLEKRVNIL
jgi:hypothetical protein